MKLDIDVEKIKKLYEEGLSERAIAKKLKVSRSTIHNRIYDIHYNYGNRKRFTLDENFFDLPNDINSYWAGFLAADGCIHRNCVSLEIHNKDEKHLHKIRSLLNYNGDVSRRKNKDLVNLSITSNKIVETLEKNFNIIPKKAKVLESPNIYQEHCIRSFIRGYIDGDGCYSPKYNLISIRGTNNMLEWIKSNLNQFADINTKSSVLYDYGSYRFQIRGKIKYNKAIKWLFKNANNFTVLDRKYQLLESVGPINMLCLNVIEIKDYNKIRQNIIKERKDGKTKKEISNNNGVSVQFITNVLKDNNINYIDKRRLSDEEKLCIIKELCNNSFKEVSRLHNVNISTIYEIFKRYKGEN